MSTDLNFTCPILNQCPHCCLIPLSWALGGGACWELGEGRRGGTERCAMVAPKCLRWGGRSGESGLSAIALGGGSSGGFSLADETDFGGCIIGNGVIRVSISCGCF